MKDKIWRSSLLLCNNPNNSRERQRAGLKHLAAGYALAEIRKDFVGEVVNFKSSAIIPQNLASVSEQD